MEGEGVVLGGRFRTLRKLGEGGQAGVWLADDLEVGGQAAVKILAVPGEGDTESARRFRREYELCAGFSHPNVVRFLGAGPTGEGGAFYAMEYLACPSLDRVLAGRGALGPDRVRDLGRQMASGLAHVHARGVLHRDLKPANVMMTEEGRVVLVDFGLARDDTRTRLTATGMLLGTPYYMAPETILGDEVDARSDLFGVGAVLFEALTGERAFEAPDLVAVTRRIVAGDHASPSLWQEAPDELVVVVERLLSVDPDERYPTAAALEKALAPTRATEQTGRGGRSGALRRSASPSTGGHGAPSSSGMKRTGAHSGVGPRAPQRRLLPAILALVALGAGLAAVGGWRGTRGTAPSVVLGGVTVGDDWVAASWSLEGGGTATLVAEEEGGAVHRSPPSEGGRGGGAVLGLPSGRLVRVWAEGSSGVRSLAQTLRTSGAGAVVLAEGDAALLAWSEPGGWKAVLTAVEPGGRRLLGELHGTGPGRWRPVVGQVGPDTTDVEVALSSPLRPAPRVLSLAAAVRAAAADLGPALRRVNPAALLDGVEDVVDALSDKEVDAVMGEIKGVDRPGEAAKESRRQRREARHALVAGRLREHGIPELVGRLRSVSPLLGAGRLLAGPALQSFQADMAPLQELRLRSRFLEADWEIVEPFPDLPCLRCSPAASLRPDEVLVLASPQDGLVMGLQNPFTPGGIERFSRVVEVRDVATVRGAEVRLRTKRLRYLALSLFVDGHFVGPVHREPMFGIDYFGEGTTWQRIPVEFLREGACEVRLEVEGRFVRNPRHQAVIDELALVIERRR